MQEKFALRKTLKKVAAVGTSLAMVGVTISGALAAGLSDYSTNFTKTNTVVVFGEAGTDSVAVSDVVAGLPGGATSTTAEQVEGALALDDFETGERQDFEPGINLSQAAAFGKTCFNDNDDLGLSDWEQNINVNRDADYDVHEEFCFGTGLSAAAVRLTTSLHQGDDDLGTEPIIMIPENGLNYTLIFEENLDANNRIVNASTTDQIKIEQFVGKKLVISGAAASPAQITALVGDEYQMHTGDTVVAGDCTLNLLAIDANEILVEVNGETKSVNEDSNERFGGKCEVHVDSAIETTDGEGIAVVFLGDQASETFNNGERAPGEDKNEFLWEWQLSNLDAQRPLLGLTLHEDFTSDREDFDDEIMDLGLVRTNRRHLKEGDYVCLPNYHACLVLEGPKEEVNRCTIDFNADQQTETLPGFPNTMMGSASRYTNANVLEVEATGCGTDQGFKVDNDGDGSFTLDTDRVLLFWDNDLHTNVGIAGKLANEGGGELIVYYENADGNVTMANASSSRFGHGPTDVNRTLATEDVLFQIDNDDFDEADVSLWEIVNGTAHVANNGGVNDSTLALISIELDDEGGGITSGSKPRLFFEASLGSGIAQLGAQQGEDTTKWLRYATNSSNVYGENKSVSSFDEDVLALSGVLLPQLEDNYNDDKLVLEVPRDDEFEFFVRVARPKAGVVTTTGTISSSVSMSDADVEDVNALGKNVVVVGGPAVNKVAADLLGVDFPTYGPDLAGLAEGTAVLEMRSLTGGKQALLAYGWEQDDTRRAAVLLQDPTVLDQKLSDASLSDADSVTVTGTDLEVGGITVSA